MANDLALDIRAQPLQLSTDTYLPLSNLIQQAHFVLIGEATHGTHEFYETRAQITKWLIEEHGFNGVAAEADFPDAYRINCYARGVGDDTTAEEALGDFTRFPSWMWRNTVVRDFVEWMREHNQSLPHKEQVGFYGLDLYSLHRSMEAVIGYLDKIDPEAAQRARYRYGCFEDFGEDPQAYGYTAGFDLAQSCEDEAVKQLVELQAQHKQYLRGDSTMAEEEFFYAEQNARLAKNAEAYYRSMFTGRVSSWNLRDQHMAETLDALANHLKQTQGDAKIVVWAHNSHLGDARATEMGAEGELNLGQLARERYGRDCFNIGFSTYTGTVTAASNWGGQPERKRVRPALPNSYEDLFHQSGIPHFLMNLRDAPPLLYRTMLQRAIGVIYRPDTERVSHYFRTRLADQFDAMIHLDETRALEPLNSQQVGK